MTPEELLIPRYLMIADYPQSNINPFKPGDILTKNGIHFTRMNNPKSLHQNEINNYPHLFKKLEWWEERRDEDMPEYVKFLELPHEVFKIAKCYHTFFEATNGVIIYWECPFTEVIPATKEEYAAYQI